MLMCTVKNPDGGGGIKLAKKTRFAPCPMCSWQVQKGSFGKMWELLEATCTWTMDILNVLILSFETFLTKGRVKLATRRVGENFKRKKGKHLKKN